MHFACFLRRCKVLRQLQSVHAAVIVTGFYSLSPNATHTALLRTLTLLRPLPLPSISLPYALSLFHSLPHPATTLVHNVLIRFHLSICPSSPLLAIRLFSRLRGLFLYPDHHSFPLAISASSRLRHIPLGQALHAQSLRFGFSGDLFVCNALISMYSSIDYLPDAYRVFVEQIQVVDTVSYNALMYGYARAGDLEMVHHLFDGMPQRDAVSWGTIISAYSRARRPNDALRLFERMQADGLQPDNVALASALSCCAQLGELAKGKAIHEYITTNKSELTVKLSTGLVDMYAKCGAINTAMNVFDASPCKNLFTWNALIIGLAMHGYGKLSLNYFNKMRACGVQPDGITLLGVLVACSHSGLTEIARELFDVMETVHGVRRELKHYGCMADLLGRAGLIKEAMEMIDGMPMQGDAFVWGGVLTGCRMHRGNVGFAEIAARHLLQLDPWDSGVYSIMVGIYAQEARWEDVARIRRLMEGLKVKSAGLSLVEVFELG